MRARSTKVILREVDFKSLYNEFKGDKEALKLRLKVSDNILRDLISATFGNATTTSSIPEAVEISPQEARKNITNKFDTLELLVKGVADGKISGVLVSGPGGTGKTYTVEETLKGENINYIRISGHISPLSLYETLYQNCLPGQILVFDDCDSVFETPQTINILKAALETSPSRTIHWNSHSGLNQAPPVFDYQGALIFLTNKVLKGLHFEALVSRIHHMEMTFTDSEILYRIEDVMEGVNHRGIEADMKLEVLQFMKDHKAQFIARGALNLRSFLKVLDLRALSDARWKDMTKSMLFCK